MPECPQHWITNDTPQLDRVASGPSLLLLDYDGTLAPFHDDRMQAVPSHAIVERLEQLLALPSVHLALVTGRSARELRSLLPHHLAIEIWGSHGREHLDANGAYRTTELSLPQQASLDELELALRNAGLAASIERKPASLAAHSRLLPPAARATLEQIARRIFSEHGQPAGLELLVFDGGIELRSGDIHKGHAVLHMLTQYPNAIAAYLGDDVTDEDAFAALDARGLTVLVRDEPRPTRAAFWLRPPDELLAFLDAWISAARRASAPHLTSPAAGA